jgi:FkbH-like protein
LLASRLKRPVLQHIYAVPEEEFLGVAERRANWTASHFVELLNDRLIKAAPSFVKWVDVDRLAARVGRQNWHDIRLYHHGKFGFSSRFLPEYTFLLLATLRSAFGKTKKALILDLDNTLWGGIIGDDGIDGIRLGSGTEEGEAYLTFCNYLKNLGQRGVILGICSKNEFSIATEVFENHPNMPLKLGDFAVIRCNWEDKATNLLEIAKELNIDISSIVFVDDNRAECELIRQVLPEVYTIHVEGEPAFFIRKLDHQHLFDSPKFLDEDINRTNLYKARTEAMVFRAKAPNLEAYLSSLEMRASIIEAGANELPRLAQMELKTNQFNLSTRRLSEEQLQEMMSSLTKDVFAISMKDRFVDHGLVSYVATEFTNESLIITDWLMSCRVFSRTLECLIFNYLVKHAIKNNVYIIQTCLKPTAKNKVMNGMLESFSFYSVGQSPEGPWRYNVDLNNKEPLQSYISLLPAATLEVIEEGE